MLLMYDWMKTLRNNLLPSLIMIKVNRFIIKGFIITLVLLESSFNSQNWELVRIGLLSTLMNEFLSLGARFKPQSIQNLKIHSF